MKLVLPKDRPMSWNTLYSGSHWSHRKFEAERVHYLVREAIGYDPIMFKNPVDIAVSAYFDTRPLDPDNISSKFYIDGMKGLLISDDNYKFINSVTTRSKVDKDNPRVEIEIY